LCGCAFVCCLCIVVFGVVCHTTNYTHTTCACIDDASVTVTYIASPKSVIGSGVDNTPPTSLMTDPVSALTLAEGESYTIKGISVDAGGSYVQKVEVSVDAGSTWSVVEDVTYLASSYKWEYTWEDAVEGDYTIQVRATDAVGNIETPSAGVKATVTGTAVSPAPTPVPTLTPTPPPAGEMTLAGLETALADAQQQLLGLLKKLVALLTAQL